MALSSSLLLNLLAAAVAVVALRIAEMALGRRFWPRLISDREVELERQVAVLRLEVSQLRDQYLEAVKRESVGLRQVTELQETIRNLMAELDGLRTAQEKLRRAVNAKPRLLVALNTDPQFQIDLAALRAVRSRTGMEFQRVVDVTSGALAAHLERARSHGKSFEFVHLGVHGSEQGLAFRDGVMRWDWLSVALDGVEVLLLAACLSSKVGDWLGVVPHVVSMSEGVENEDAARFAQLFWMEMGRGASPDEALRIALDRSPAQMQEFVIAHW